MKPKDMAVDVVFFFLSHFLMSGSNAAGGKWDLLLQTTGISAMHMQLLHNDRVILFDVTDFGPSNISLPASKQCRKVDFPAMGTMDCSAHSVEYDVCSNSVRPLTLLTNTWCSSGTVAPDGRLMQTGGYGEGDRAARIFTPCGECDWEETPSALTVRRWYATNQILPDGRAILVGGRREFSYEFYPKSGPSDGVSELPFLRQTRDHPEENNLYPFIHLNVDGNLFVFANDRAVLLDYQKNRIVRTFSAIPGGDPRNYPSSGSSVLLPLAGTQEAEVMICGGAPIGSFDKVTSSPRSFVGALSTCGRLKITDESPEWAMETMPIQRVMGDMVLLPDGSVLIINGAKEGTAGWEFGQNPAMNPIIYRPDKLIGSRFEVQNPSTRPRLYHSTAILVRDGRVLVGGSNPHNLYNFSATYPTDLSLEAFSPSYLSSSYSKFRPAITSPSSPAKLSYGNQFEIRFQVPGGLPRSGSVYVTMVAPSFATHSFSMNQRLLVLGSGEATTAPDSTYQIEVSAPNSPTLAPPGYYLLFVVNARIPSQGIWVQIQ